MKPSYKSLEKFLKATPQHVQKITLSFEQVEMIVGAPLPTSHLTHRQWWENQADIARRPQARAWTNAGFQVDKVNQAKTNGWVRFRRLPNSMPTG